MRRSASRVAAALLTLPRIAAVCLHTVAIFLRAAPLDLCAHVCWRARDLRLARHAAANAAYASPHCCTHNIRHIACLYRVHRALSVAASARSKNDIGAAARSGMFAVMLNFSGGRLLLPRYSAPYRQTRFAPRRALVWQIDARRYRLAAALNSRSARGFSRMVRDNAGGR